MAQIASWNGHTFEVSAQLIRSFEDFSLKGSCETEDKKSGKQQYAKRKNGKPAELSFKVGLNALLGVTDVRGEALTYVDEAEAGATEYFYLGTQKLIAAKMMLTSAEVTEYVTMPGNGDVWISCDVKLTFKQGSSDGGKSGKKSKKKKSNRGKGKGDGDSASGVNAVLAKLKHEINVIQSGKDGSKYKLTDNSLRSLLGKKTPGASLQEKFNRAADSGRNSGTKKNPTTGRSAGGSLSVKLKATR